MPEGHPLNVDATTRDTVLGMSTLYGAREGEERNDRRDTDDANALMTVTPGIVSALRQAEALPESKGAKKARSVMRRVARETIHHIWEVPRLRTGADKPLAHKYGFDAAWSPAALALVVDKNGDRLPHASWSGKLVLEHVVPASTVAKIVARMHELGKGNDDVAEMLYACTNHAVVKKTGQEDPARDQPTAGLLDADTAEKWLIDHFTDGPAIPDETCFFGIAWSRYLDPAQRGADAQEMPWQLEDLRTLRQALRATAGSD